MTTELKSPLIRSPSNVLGDGSRCARPNFFIVGAPKCGTTSLYAYLNGHPNVFLPTRKEPTYWCADFPGFRGVTESAEYLDLFSAAADRHRAVGEASTLYFYSREAPRGIQTFNPDAKIVIMLRNPLEVVHSWHAHLCYTCDENETDFERAWNLQAARREGRHIPPGCRAPELLDYARIGKLAQEIRRWMMFFPSSQVRCFLLDDFVRSSEIACRQVQEFLELSFDGRVGLPRLNENKTTRSATLARMLHRPPSWLVKAVERAKRAFGVRSLGVYRWIARSEPRAQLTPDMERALCREFADDISDLGQLLNRDLSSWLAPLGGKPAST